jgi:hypothetical protein
MNKKTRTTNIVEYAKTHLNTVNIEEYNEVDFAILSKLVYFNFEVFLGYDFNKEMKLSDLYDFSKFDEFLKRPSLKKEDPLLISALCGNPRFKNIIIKHYEYKVDKNNLEQFSAITFILDNKDMIIAYRGTDATITGWNEDFNMAIKTPVPAQNDALVYVNKVAKEAKRNIYLIGHSKGGNLALYSLLTCDESFLSRIKKCYSFDGPGLEPNFFATFDKKRLQNIYLKVVPNESIIGMIFDNDEPLRIIKSDRSLLLQHNLYTWRVNGNKFVDAKKLSDSIKSFDVAFNEWVKNCNEDERSLIINMIFTIIKNGKVNKAIDVINNKANHFKINKMINEYRSMDKTKREQFGELALRLFKTLFNNDNED